MIVSLLARRLLLLTTVALADITAAVAPPPNIILFLVDDMGWQDTSVPFWEQPTPANTHFRTPNMERLARQGVTFTHARAHPVCTPTRVSIMTGKSPVRHHVTNWILFPDKDPSGDWGPTGPPASWRLGGIQPEDLTLPGLLRTAGYTTVHAGKGHWGGVGTGGADPRALGFDVNIAGHAAGSPASFQGLDDFGNRPQNGRVPPQAVPGLADYHGQDIHLTDALTAEVKRALNDAAAAGKPFYLNFAHYAVHAPIQPHKRFMEHYADKNYPGTDIPIPVEEQRYASMIEGMDASLGDLLETLESLGTATRTLVIFTSDNGGLSAHARGTTPRDTGDNTHCWPLRAGKGSAYDGGTRVPFLISWAQPDAAEPVQARFPLAAGMRNAQPIISEDLFPTILGIAGITTALPSGYVTDGRDIRPYALGTAMDPERPLYFHYPHVWGPRGPGYEPHTAAVFGRWKIIYFYNRHTWELYDLAEDIGESHDLAGVKPALLAQLAAKMKAGLLAMDVQWPVDRASGKETPPQWPAAP